MEEGVAKFQPHSTDTYYRSSYKSVMRCIFSNRDDLEKGMRDELQLARPR